MPVLPTRETDSKTAWQWGLVAGEGLFTISEKLRSYVTDLSQEEFEQAFDMTSIPESYSVGWSFPKNKNRRSV